ncbi:MAG TPA: hypothetical protein VMU69_25165 [Bradyrhizobium sp.]|nr:hypothetical protein [Bradyrhizobium sp.]
MMLPAPRIIAIDDNPAHLRGLADGLNRYGAACLQVHFTGEDTEIKKCPHVRVIFADLHLNESGASGEHERHFAIIGGLIEEAIVPAGPYIVVLWTRFADQAEALGRFLDERLQGVQKPFAVVPLDKMVHLTAENKIKDIDQLVQAIDGIVRQQPQIAALLNWEERVLGAAAETVSAIIGLAIRQPGDQRGAELRRLLGQLGIEAVGEGHVENDRFAAVNEALLPILADRISFLRSRAGVDDIWAEAFTTADITAARSIEESAKLNRLLHVAEGATGAERGAVILLPADYGGDGFKGAFGMEPAVAAEKQYGCVGFSQDNVDFRWLLVQTQAACDFAQKQPGPMSFVLALEMPIAAISKNSPPAAVWRAPPLDFDGKVRAMIVNCRFQISISEARASTIASAYRIREQLLNDLIYKIHTYGARPGIISFHEKKAKPVGADPSPPKKS